MKSSSAKSKGRKLQNKVRDLIAERYGFEPDTAVMGERGKDVRHDRLPYSIECKNVEKLNLWAAWQQAKDNLFAGDTPVVIFTRNQHDTLAVVPVDWFIDRMEIRNYDGTVQQTGGREGKNTSRGVPGEGHGRVESCDQGTGDCMVCRCLAASGWTRPGSREDKGT